MNISKRGFTLIEVTMVILLLGILMTVAYSQYVDFAKDARINVTTARLNDLRTAIVGDPKIVGAGQYINPGFIIQVGSVPTSLDDLVTQGAYPAYNPYSKTGWRGPYILTDDPNWKQDSWGVNFVYSSVSRTIKSCGPDRTCGNSDDITVSF